MVNKLNTALHTEKTLKQRINLKTGEKKKLPKNIIHWFIVMLCQFLVDNRFNIYTTHTNEIIKTRFVG